MTTVLCIYIFSVPFNPLPGHYSRLGVKDGCKYVDSVCRNSVNDT